jgi:very-short-patch-repair endonuclease
MTDHDRRKVKRRMTGTHKNLSQDLCGQGIQHRNEVRLFAGNWEYSYVADIYIPQCRIVIEVDGPSHDGGVRIKNSEVEDIEDRAARKLDRLLRYR